MTKAELFIKAAKHFGELAAKVQDDQWELPTPDEGWSVRDLVNHVVAEALWMPELLAGKTVAEVGGKYNGDVLGENPVGAVDAAKSAAVKAVGEDGVEDRMVDLSRGPTKASDYIEEMFCDHLVHAWDLAAAIGGDRLLPQDLVGPCYEYFQNQAEAWRTGGAFAAKVTVAEDASTQDKLLALTGRDPNWKPPENTEQAV